MKLPPSNGGNIQPAGPLLVHVRSSKTNQTGERKDIRVAKNGFAAAVEAMRPRNSDPSIKVFELSAQTIGRRFTEAAKAAGFTTGRITAHTGRVSLASELTRMGASTTAVMLVGGWSTAHTWWLTTQLAQQPSTAQSLGISDRRASRPAYGITCLLPLRFGVTQSIEAPPPQKPAGAFSGGE